MGCQFLWYNQIDNWSIGNILAKFSKKRSNKKTKISPQKEKKKKKTPFNVLSLVLYLVEPSIKIKIPAILLQIFGPNMAIEKSQKSTWF